MLARNFLGHSIHQLPLEAALHCTGCASQCAPAELLWVTATPGNAECFASASARRRSRMRLLNRSPPWYTCSGTLVTNLCAQGTHFLLHIKVHHCFFAKPWLPHVHLDVRTYGPALPNRCQATLNVLMHCARAHVMYYDRCYNACPMWLIHDTCSLMVHIATVRHIHDAQPTHSNGTVHHHTWQLAPVVAVRRALNSVQRAALNNDGRCRGRCRKSAAARTTRRPGPRPPLMASCPCRFRYTVNITVP